MCDVFLQLEGRRKGIQSDCADQIAKLNAVVFVKVSFWVFDFHTCQQQLSRIQQIKILAIWLTNITLELL